MTEVKFSEDYDVYLRNLKKLIVKADILKVDSNIKKDKIGIIDNLKDLYNKLFLYQTYKDKLLISVTGFQGAGKTSLVRDYFNIPEAILPENNARGEKLPVFISSQEIDEVTAYKYKSEIIDGEIKIVPEKLNVEDVENATKNPLETNDLWIELKVPSENTKIKSNNTNVVLLPGYEKLSSDFSQKLLDFIVNVSASSIVVVDKNSLARKSTNDILNKINNKFEDLKPIIAITHGDEKPEQNDEVRREVISSLNVEDEERVIVTGPSKDFGEEWKTDITNALNSYGEKGNSMFEASEESRKLTLQDILYDIDMEINELSDILENESKSIELDDIMNEKDISADLFKEEYEKYLGELQKSLTMQMSEFKSTKQDELINIVDNNTGFWKNLKVRLIGENIRNEQKMTQDLKKLWESKDKNNLNALGNMNKSAIRVLRDFDNIYTLPEKENKFELIEEKSTSSLMKINNYFNGDSSKKGQKDVKNLDLHDVKGLVYLGASFLTHSYKALENEEIQNNLEEISKYDVLNKEKNEDNKMLNITIIDDPSFKKADKKEMEVYDKFRENIVNAIPLVLGVDLFSDGKMDMAVNPVGGVTKASEALGAIGIKISSRALLSVAGGAVVVAATSYAIKQNLQDLNKRQMSLYNNASLFIDTLGQSQIYNYVESLRNTFEKMEEKLRYRHFQLNNNNEKVSAIQSCRYLLSKVQAQTSKTLERSYDEKLLF